MAVTILSKPFVHFCVPSRFRSNLKRDALYAILFALSQAGPMFCFAAAFALGAYLVGRQDITMLAVFR